MSWGCTSYEIKVRGCPLDFVKPLCFCSVPEMENILIKLLIKIFIYLHQKIAIKYPRFCSFFIPHAIYFPHVIFYITLKVGGLSKD